MNARTSHFVVAAWEGNTYYREVMDDDTTQYMDEELAIFNTLNEARRFIRQVEGAIALDYQDFLDECEKEENAPYPYFGC